jgi:hypothetical protein
MNKCPNCNYEDEDHEDEMEEDVGPCDECGRDCCICRDIEECNCGSWQWSERKKEYIMISDCCC